MKFHCVTVLAITVFIVAVSIDVGESLSGKTTRYWDCCKPSCSWPGKASVSSPVRSCHKNGVEAADPNGEQNGCGGGSAFTCNSQQPFIGDGNAWWAYGFAAAKLIGQSENDWCCACYKLNFTSGPVSNQVLVVQVTNTGGDLGDNHFDLQLPGSGVGLFNGCSPQWGAPSPDGWGDKYGGVRSRDDCNQLPSEIRGGCFFRFDWFKNAQNPTMWFERYPCPDRLTEKTGCRRNDEHKYFSK